MNTATKTRFAKTETPFGHLPALVAALMLGATGVAQADIVAFSAIGAGGVDVGVNGTFDTLLTGPVAYATGRDFSDNEHRWAMEFNLSTLPAGAVIQSAKVKLRTSVGDQVGQVSLFGYAGDGSVTLGDMTAGSRLLTFTPADSTQIDYDVTAFVLGTYSAAQAWLGFSLRQDPLEASGGGLGDLWNGPDNFPAPALTITYSVATVPEPTTALLVALSGVALLASTGRRRKAATQA